MATVHRNKFGFKRFVALLCVIVFAAAAIVAVSTVRSLNFHPFGINKPSSVSLPKGCATIAAGLDWTASPTNFSGPVAKTPPMGFSSYPQFGTDVNQQQIMGIATAMVNNNMAAAGYRYVYIDDGWQGRRVDGKLTANPARFPCGIKLMADYLHAKGLKLGLYTTPGKVSCGGNTGSYGHVDADVATFAAWGVDAIKLDWCYANGAEAESITEQWHNAIIKSGRPMVLGINAGGNPVTGTWAMYYANEWRTSDDICPSWFSKTQRHAPGAAACYNGKYQSGVYDYLTTSDTGANALNVGPGHWADPDALEAGNTGLSYIEGQTQFSIWAMWSAPLIIGGDPQQMPSDDLQMLLNPKVIAIDQDTLGIMAHLFAGSAEQQIWVKPLADHAIAIAAVNLSNGTRAITLNWADLGIQPISVYNVWLNTYPKYSQKGITVRLPAHGTALLLII